MPVAQPARSAKWVACLLLSAVIGLATLVAAQTDLGKMRAIALQRYGQDTANVVDEWQALIERMSAMDDSQKLALTNKFINDRIRWVQDPAFSRSLWLRWWAVTARLLPLICNHKCWIM